MYSGRSRSCLRSTQSEESSFGGAGFSRESALLACIGEGVERYCCRFVDGRSLKFGSFEDYKDQAVDPALWSLYSPLQYALPRFPFVPLLHSTPLWWAQAYSLFDSESKLVPACFLYMPYEIREPEAPITPAISTGLSCASSCTQAILQGLYEVIERDALAITWLKQVPVCELVDMPEDISLTFNRGPITYHVYDITSDVNIPVYLVLSIGDSAFGRLISVGTACNLDPLRALRKAFLENAQGRLALMHLREKHTGWVPQADFADVNTFEDHALVLTCCPDLLGQVRFLGAKGKKSFRENFKHREERPDKALALCLEQLDKAGFEPLAKDLTTEDIRPIGLSVVRTLIPGMQPLHGTHILPFLGGNRLESAADIFSVREDEVLPAGQFNPIPHPLP